ncbi:MAG TPA: alginate lyase family protein [Bryobacteraceae bacterium]|nr:alginate lyase family protein [Bryobacteraceae bacterium]
MTLVSEDEAEPIHSAIIRKEAWTLDTVRRLRAEADRRMSQGPWSVTSERPKGIDLDPHDYYSEAPYWWPNPESPDGSYVRRDGQVNPSRFVANNSALNSMCDAVLTLGTAAFLLDDTRYAQRATRVIHAWFINPKTRMTPNLDYAQAVPGLNNGRGAGILDGRAFIRAIQGMEFLAQTGAWDAKDQAAVRKWFEEYLHWLADSKNAGEEKASANNHASWWTAQVAAVATFVEDRQATQMAFNYYRDHIFPRQIRGDGSAPREEARTKSLTYSAFNLEALTMVCRIAQVHNTDLWPVRAKSGATIGTVIDYLLPYLADPRKWSKEQIADFQNDSLYFLAFAGMGLKKPEYVALFRKLERPEGAWLCLVDLMVGRWEAAAHQTRH